MYQKDGSCIFEVKDLKKEDTGSWTCKMSNKYGDSDAHEFNVEVRGNGRNFDNPPTTTTTNSINDNDPDSATRPTAFMTFSIFAIPFLIVF